ncbi:hypothetical protein [Lyngbya sp. CCY1209]|uniref:hypothetical protein n=1 Tax=Lyngbya sp. CCY1209 TaxID=2886103 RepID=UPI002D20FA01|nr:hypothetical protein [Lyngbya sp. CCY1209]MEB3885788.1 hypothetical protein [Lyngbya sp. CCY1209]
MRRFQFIVIPAGVLSLLFGMMFRVGIAPARAQIMPDGIFDEEQYGRPFLQRGVQGATVQDLQIFRTPPRFCRRGGRQMGGDIFSVDVLYFFPKGDAIAAPAIDKIDPIFKMQSFP